MKLIRYLGPHHVVILSSGEAIRRGETAEVPDADADYMARSPHVRVDVFGSHAPRKRKPEADSGEGPTEPVHRHGQEDKE